MKKTMENNNYINGSVAYDFDIRREIEEFEAAGDFTVVETRSKKRKSIIGVAYMLFLVLAVCSCAFVLTYYLNLTSRLTTATKEIAKLETELNTLKNSNDEEYNKLLSSINIEDVKRIAVSELGMKYADSNSVIVFEADEKDFMRSVSGSAQ